MTDETTGELENLPDPEELEEDKEHTERKNRRLSEADYARIKELYELGEKRVSELADEYGVSRQALHKRFKADEVVYGSRAAEVAAATKAAVTRAAERYAEKRTEWIEETRITAFNDLKRARLIANKIVAEALKAKLAIKTCDADLKAHNRYILALQKTIEMQLRVLEADNAVSEEDLPELVVSDMSDDDIREHHIRNGVTDADELAEIIEQYAGGSADEA